MSRKVISEAVISRPVGSALGYARRFQNLAVYKKARQLSREVFIATKTFPQEERFSLTEQLRRASRSVGAQIAESWAKRRYEKHFVSKLSDADGEQMEAQHWLTSAFDCGYLSREETQRLGELCLEIGRMLGDMMRKSGQFCHSEAHLGEEAPEYGVKDSLDHLTED